MPVAIDYPFFIVEAQYAFLHLYFYILLRLILFYSWLVILAHAMYLEDSWQLLWLYK